MPVEEERISGGREEGVASEWEELECGICCMPYDRCGRAPRRLGAAHGSWKPSRCRHVMCSACVCRLAREGWWEEVTCPYCRAVTPLRERGGVGGVVRRRRLVLPPIDAELWHRVVRLQEKAAEAGAEEEAAEEEEEEEKEKDGDEEGQQWRLWRAFKRLLRGEGSGTAHARSRRGRGRRRSNSLPIGRRRLPINPYGSEMKDLALMTCYII